MYENHEMLKKASVQTMSNLLFSEEVVKLFEGKNDRTKYLVLLSTSEDVEMSKAAAGALAILTSVSKRASRKVFEVCLLFLKLFPEIDFNLFLLLLNLSIGDRVERNPLLPTEQYGQRRAISRGCYRQEYRQSFERVGRKVVAT